jgi:hypothetical protein
VNGKSAIEWIMDRYQVKTDKASGIVNDPNRWAAEAGDPRYVVDLLRRIITVSVETVSIVNAMPPLTPFSPNTVQLELQRCYSAGRAEGGMGQAGG